VSAFFAALQNVLRSLPDGTPGRAKALIETPFAGMSPRTERVGIAERRD